MAWNRFFMGQIILTDRYSLNVDDALHMPSVQSITVSLDPIQNDSLTYEEIICGRIRYTIVLTTNPTSNVKDMLK